MMNPRQIRSRPVRGVRLELRFEQCGELRIQFDKIEPIARPQMPDDLPCHRAGARSDLQHPHWLCTAFGQWIGQCFSKVTTAGRDGPGGCVPLPELL